MRPFAHASSADVANLHLAIAMLKKARTLLRYAKAQRAAARVMAAISSKRGAHRHGNRRRFVARQETER